MRRSRGGGQGSRIITKNIGFLRSPENYKGTKPAFNVGPSPAFRWSADDGPLIVISGSSLPNQLKTLSKLDPL